MRNIWMLLVVFSIFTSTVAYAGDHGFSDFSIKLSALRDTCVQQASAANRAFSSAQYQETLDSQTAQLQAETDAQVYGVGHGRRETTDFLISRSKENSEASAARTQQISGKAESDKQRITECVASAEKEGKSSYSDFKKTHKREASSAEALMAAWLANVEEITFDRPQGGDATESSWKKEKAHAELSSL